YPDEFEHAFFEEVEFIAQLDTHLAGELSGGQLFVASKEHRIARADLRLLCDAGEHVGRDEFGDRPFAGQRAAFLLEYDIAKSRRTFFPGPVIELVEERARLCRRFWAGNGAHHAASGDDFLEGVEGDGRLVELRRHIDDL